MATDSPPTQPSAAASHTPVNPETLAGLHGLQVESGVEIFNELVSIYIAAGAALVGRIKIAAAQNDFAALRNAAHSLKGSSASMGALHLSGLCATLDRPEPDSTVNSLEQANKIETEFQRVKTFLQGELTSSGKNPLA